MVARAKKTVVKAKRPSERWPDTGSATGRKGPANRKGKVSTAPPAQGGGIALDRQGIVRMEDVADRFGLSKLQVARSLGLPKEALHKRERFVAPKTQQRLREMLEIVNRVSHWAGGQVQAMAWYRGESIPALGDQTAEALVKAGKADVVREYLDGIALGGFA